MKKRRTKLLALTLSVCLTLTSFSPVAAASETTVVTNETENTGNNMLEDILLGEDSSSTEDQKEASEGTEDVIEPTEIPEEPGIPDETQSPKEDGNAEAPDATTTPEVTETPEATATPEATETPEVTKEEVQAEEAVSASLVKADTILSETDTEWKMDAKTGKFQLFKKSGDTLALIKKEAGIVQISYSGNLQCYYTFDSDGYLLTGLQTVKDNQYYFNSKGSFNESNTPEGTTMTPANSTYGSMVFSQWVQPTGTQWVYLGEDGKRDNSKVGMQKIGQDTYYLDKNGTMFRNDLKKISGVWYAFDKYGVMVTNDFYTYSANKQKYYFQANGKKLQKSGWQKLNGSFYYFRKSSYSWQIRSGFQKIKDTDGKTYTFYFNPSGVMFKNAFYKKNSNEWYYLDGNGHRVTGERKVKIGGKNYYYYFRTSKGSKNQPVGSAVTGWYKIGKYWHYFSKKYKRAATGPAITKVGKYKYYFTSTGKAQRGGFRDFKGKRYYFTPQKGSKKPYLKVNTWIKKGSKWYRATEDGSLAKGWEQIGKSWYYFGSDYVMDKSRSATRGNKKGYLDDDGKFVTNSWIKFKGNWKYIDSKEGFATGWKTISGYKYYFTKNGYLSQDVRRLFRGRPASMYKLEVDKTKCTVTVFTKDTTTGKYNIPVVVFLCSVGQPIGRTPNGTFTTNRGGRWQLLMGPSYGQYGVNVYAGVIYFHSVAGGGTNSYSVPWYEYNRLGTPASHGCIRLCVSDAKWIYENCVGAKVTIYNSASRPTKFDKPTLPKMGAGQTYDPTDPAVRGTSPSPHKNPA